MHLTVNGKPRDVDASANGADGAPLFDVLAAFEVNPKLVAVAINGDVIPKSEFALARVREGDALEIVRMVGGGAAAPLPPAPSPTGGEGESCDRDASGES